MSKPKYITGEYTLIDAPMEHHKRGLQWTLTGYGSRIPSRKKVLWDGRKYRLYVSIWSNMGTSYIISKGERLIIPS